MNFGFIPSIMKKYVARDIAGGNPPANISIINTSESPHSPDPDCDVPTVVAPIIIVETMIHCITRIIFAGTPVFIEGIGNKIPKVHTL